MSGCEALIGQIGIGIIGKGVEISGCRRWSKVEEGGRGGGGGGSGAI